MLFVLNIVTQLLVKFLHVACKDTRKYNQATSKCLCARYVCWMTHETVLPKQRYIILLQDASSVPRDVITLHNYVVLVKWYAIQLR